MPAQIFETAELGPVTLRNRFVKAATFEGMSPKNVVTTSLIDFHRRMAAGGVSMTTVSYIAVAKEGMGAPAEIYIHDGAAEGLARIAEAIHAEGAKISAQIGHAGAVGGAEGKRTLGPSKGRTRMGAPITEITPTEIDAVVANFADAATMLRDAGFDSVEVHLGHHYLLSSFLSPKWNRRKDAYGGSTQARAAFPIRVINAVRQAAGPGMAVTAKMNMFDGVRGGLQVDESIEVAKLFEATGALDALEFSGGGSQQNQMAMFRGDVPRKEFEQILPSKIMKYGFRLFGRWLLPGYPFTEGYFLDTARRFRAELKMPLIYLGGVNKLSTAQAAVDAGFDFVAMGRALVRQPDLINQMRDDASVEGTCIHCNKCMLSIYTGTRCTIDQPQPVKIVR